MENFVSKVLFTERCNYETDRDSIAIAITTILQLCAQLPSHSIKVRLGLTLLGQELPCFSYANDAVLMLISGNLHNKSSEVSIENQVSSSVIFIPRPGNYAHNCKMVYQKPERELKEKKTAKCETHFIKEQKHKDKKQNRKATFIKCVFFEVIFSFCRKIPKSSKKEKHTRTVQPKRTSTSTVIFFFLPFLHLLS